MELRDYSRALQRHWLAIVLMTVVGIAVGFGWASIQTPVYQADAGGLIKPRSTALEGGGVLGAQQSDSMSRAKVSTYLEMATWRSTAEAAAAELGIDEKPDVLVRRITVENPEGTAILTITATGSSPESARDLATAWVNGLIATIDANEGVDGAPGTSEMTVSLAESATLPSSPAFPDIRLAMLVGGVLGLGGGIAFALIRAVSDRRIRSTDDVEERLGIPMMGALPESAGLADGQRISSADQSAIAGSKAARIDFALRESLRMLRTNLQFMNVDHPPRIIVVSSALPGEGKSTVSASLAHTLAEGGEQVVLIDGDLRRPTVAKTMGIRGAPGLTDALAGRVDLVQVLHQVPALPNLVVLPAGTPPPNPSELLGSERMGAMLSDLASHAIVVVDAPPLLSVTDGAVLTRHADGALLVASVGKTTYDHVEKAIAALEKIHGSVLGIVLNHMPTVGGMDAYEYAYAPRQDDGSGSKGRSGVSHEAREPQVPPVATPSTESQVYVPHTPSADSAVAPSARPGRRTRKTNTYEAGDDEGDVQDFLRAATVELGGNHDAKG